MDLLSGPWAPAVLQDALVLVEQARRQGMRIEGLAAALRRAVAALAPVHGGPELPWRDAIRCPSCGRGVLTPVANRDGLRIRGCRLCRYSEVVA